MKKSKIFISCGQANANEIKVANEISTWLNSVGYKPYIAIETQSILDVNGGIISELKSSDYYIFINFKRDEIVSGKTTFYRGSVFTNQELGIAYAMGFERMLFVNQKDVRKEGIFGYLVSNTPEFTNYDDVLPIIKEAISKAKWTNDYSRNLIIQNLRWGNRISYTDHTGRRDVKGLNVDVFNNRPDVGASNTVCRLQTISINGVKNISPDRSHLKCCGSPGYSNTIWPKDHIAFDLLSIDLNNPTNINLHSALDVNPRVPIINSIGKYELDYEVFAEGFSPITFIVNLDFTGNPNTTSANI